MPLNQNNQLERKQLKNNLPAAPAGRSNVRKRLRATISQPFIPQKRPDPIQRIKLEPLELFVDSETGYQFISRPEFSDDDESLVITISSESE